MSDLGVLTSSAAMDSTAMPPLEPLPVVAKIAEAPAKHAMSAADAAEKKLSSKEQDSILKQLNKTLEAFDTHVSLSLDAKSHQTIIKVIDTESGKVVRQIPSEQMMRISERITELLGVIYDEKM